MHIKRTLAITLVASMMLSMVAYASSDITDIPDDYSTEALLSAVDNGLLVSENNQINPEGELTRGEFATIMVRAFGATNEVDVTVYADVDGDEWYAEALAKAVAMGIMEGDGENLTPNAPITRQEACSVLARAFSISSDYDISDFSDADDVASWALDSIAAMVEAEYVLGSDGAIKPTANILRKDFVVIMDRMVEEYISDASQLTGDVIEGNIIITSADVSLEGITVTGSIIIADGVDAGAVDLTGVTVEGDIVVRSAATVTITDTTVANIIVTAITQEAEVTIAGASEVGTIIAEGEGVTITVDESATVGDVVATGEGATLNGEEVEVTIADEETVEEEETAEEETTTSTSTGSTGSGTTYYTLTLEDNDGDTATSIDAIRKSKNSTTVLEAAECDGYTFLEWNTKADGTGTSSAVGDTFTFTANTTLYAIWGYEVASAAELSDALDAEATNIIVTDSFELSNSVAIPEGTNLIINENMTLTIGDYTLTVGGTITNNGEITLNQDGAVYYGSLTGSGDIDNNDGTVAEVTFYNDDGTLVTTSNAAIILGTVTMSDDVIIDGNLVIAPDGSLTIDSGNLTVNGTIDNQGTLTNNGTIYVSDADSLTAAITNATSGTIVVTADITVTSTLTVPSSVTLEIASDKTLFVSGVLTNSGTINNDGTIYASGNVTNINSGTITNTSGTIYYGSGSTPTVTGGTTTEATFYISGNWSSDVAGKAVIIGDVTMTDDVTVSGTLVIATDCTLTINAQHDLTVGTIENYGNIKVYEADVLATVLDEVDSGTVVAVDITAENDLTVKDGATLTVATSASLTMGTYALTVNGTLIVNDNGDLYLGSGDFTVNSTGDIDNQGTIYVSDATNLATVLGAVTSGEVVITDDITLTNTITIPEGVTLTNNGTISVATADALTTALDIGGNVLMTASVTTTTDLTIPEDTTLTVDFGTTLEVTGTLTINGTLIKCGTVSVTGTITGETSGPNYTNITSLAMLEAWVTSDETSGTITADITTTSALAIASGRTLTIASSATLTLGGTLTNASGATITNEGTIKVYDDDSLTAALAATTTGGKVVVADTFEYSTGSVTVPTGVTLTVANGATLTISDGNNKLYNSGTVEVEDGGTLKITESSIINTSGITTYINNYGTIEIKTLTNNNGIVTNDEGATLSVSYALSGSSGTITNSGTIKADGSLTTAGGTITNSGTICADTVTTDSGTITNSGVLSVTGAIETKAGTITVADGGVLFANSTINNGDSDTNNSGTFNIHSGGILYAEGAITNSKGTFKIESGGILFANDTVTNVDSYGTFTNNGTIYYGDSISGTISTTGTNTQIEATFYGDSGSLAEIADGATAVIIGSVTVSSAVTNSGNLVIAPSGTLTVSGGSLSGSGDAEIIVYTGATVTGVDNVTNANTYTWSGSAWTGPND